MASGPSCPDMVVAQCLQFRRQGVFQALGARCKNAVNTGQVPSAAVFDRATAGTPSGGFSAGLLLHGFALAVLFKTLLLFALAFNEGSLAGPCTRSPGLFFTFGRT